ncbi:hypothetical protein GPECTOR_11g98 [Gonium pectorale]|uniref:Uncharacterized protein n=1 Tax=Gonium pectorale TaxID=33097 RepID=A0A150GQ42_GONPE|nr:hypothetical protein GPECTOR_11g98 [Gonium pectorale]|eukprot:KXZ51976.1 hypothetical protein GPECTOR_11g98 [Gonium pectorale]
MHASKPPCHDFHNGAQGDVLGACEPLDVVGMELKLLDLAKLVRTAQECQQQSDVLRDLQGQQLAAGLQVLQSQLQQLRSAVFAPSPVGDDGSSPLARATALGGPTVAGGEPSASGVAAGAPAPALLLARKAELEALAARVESEMLVLERLIALEGATANNRAAIAASASEQQEMLTDVKRLAGRVDALSSRVGSLLSWFHGDQGDEEQGPQRGAGLDAGSGSSLSSGYRGARAGRSRWGTGGAGHGGSSSGGAGPDHADDDDWLDSLAEEELAGGQASSIRAGGRRAGREGLRAASSGALPHGPGPGRGHATSAAADRGAQPLPRRLQSAVERTVQDAMLVAMDAWEERAAVQRQAEEVRTRAVLEVVQSISLTQQALTAPMERLAALCPRLLDALQTMPAARGAVGARVTTGAAASASSAQTQSPPSTPGRAARGVSAAVTAGSFDGTAAAIGSAAGRVASASGRSSAVAAGTGVPAAAGSGAARAAAGPDRTVRPVGQPSNADRDSLLEDAYFLAAEAGGLVEGIQHTLADAMALGQRYDDCVRPAPIRCSDSSLWDGYQTSHNDLSIRVSICLYGGLECH